MFLLALYAVVHMGPCVCLPFYKGMALLAGGLWMFSHVGPYWDVPFALMDMLCPVLVLPLVSFLAFQLPIAQAPPEVRGKEVRGQECFVSPPRPLPWS